MAQIDDAGCAVVRLSCARAHCMRPGPGLDVLVAAEAPNTLWHVQLHPHVCIAAAHTFKNEYGMSLVFLLGRSAVVVGTNTGLKMIYKQQFSCMKRSSIDQS